MTDTERLDWLIANSGIWDPPETFKDGSESKGYWFNGGCGCCSIAITPFHMDPRTAIDLAIQKERDEDSE